MNVSYPVTLRAKVIPVKLEANELFLSLPSIKRVHIKKSFRRQLHYVFI
jgi:hypothetical protein